VIRAGAALLALALLGYVIDGERIVRELARARGDAPPLRVTASLEPAEGGDGEAIVLELHPEAGARAHDSRGGRWLIRAGRVQARGGGAPDWIPPADVLGLAGEAALLGWLRDAGIDHASSRLARCGDADCYVLGVRGSDEELWLEQARFEVRRVLLRGRRAEFEGWRDFGRIRFPERIRVGDASEPAGVLRVESVERAKGLGPDDFSTAWLE
jgi:hypothetical protein